MNTRSVPTSTSFFTVPTKQEASRMGLRQGGLVSLPHYATTQGGIPSVQYWLGLGKEKDPVTGKRPMDMGYINQLKALYGMGATGVTPLRKQQLVQGYQTNQAGGLIVDESGKPIRQTITVGTPHVMDAMTPFSNYPAAQIRAEDWTGNIGQLEMEPLATTIADPNVMVRGADGKLGVPEMRTMTAEGKPLQREIWQDDAYHKYREALKEEQRASGTATVSRLYTRDQLILHFLGSQYPGRSPEQLLAMMEDPNVANQVSKYIHKNTVFAKTRDGKVQKPIRLGEFLSQVDDQMAGRIFHNNPQLTKLIEAEEQAGNIPTRQAIEARILQEMGKTPDQIRSEEDIMGLSDAVEQEYTNAVINRFGQSDRDTLFTKVYESDDDMARRIAREQNEYDAAIRLKDALKAAGQDPSAIPLPTVNHYRQGRYNALSPNHTLSFQAAEQMAEEARVNQGRVALQSALDTRITPNRVVAVPQADGEVKGINTKSPVLEPDSEPIGTVFPTDERPSLYSTAENYVPDTGTAQPLVQEVAVPVGKEINPDTKKLQTRWDRVPVTATHHQLGVNMLAPSDTMVDDMAVVNLSDDTRPIPTKTEAYDPMRTGYVDDVDAVTPEGDPLYQSGTPKGTYMPDGLARYEQVLDIAPGDYQQDNFGRVVEYVKARKSDNPKHMVYLLPDGSQVPVETKTVTKTTSTGSTPKIKTSPDVIPFAPNPTEVELASQEQYLPVNINGQENLVPIRGLQQTEVDNPLYNEFEYVNGSWGEDYDNPGQTRLKRGQYGSFPVGGQIRVPRKSDELRLESDELDLVDVMAERVKAHRTGGKERNRTIYSVDEFVPHKVAPDTGEYIKLSPDANELMPNYEGNDVVYLKRLTPEEVRAANTESAYEAELRNANPSAGGDTRNATDYADYAPDNSVDRQIENILATGKKLDGTIVNGKRQPGSNLSPEEMAELVKLQAGGREGKVVQAKKPVVYTIGSDNYQFTFPVAEPATNAVESIRKQVDIAKQTLGSRYKEFVPQGWKYSIGDVLDWEYGIGKSRVIGPNAFQQWRQSSEKAKGESLLDDTERARFQSYQTKGTTDQLSEEELADYKQLQETVWDRKTKLWNEDDDFYVPAKMGALVNAAERSRVEAESSPPVVSISKTNPKQSMALQAKAQGNVIPLPPQGEGEVKGIVEDKFGRPKIVNISLVGRERDALQPLRTDNPTRIYAKDLTPDGSPYEGSAISVTSNVPQFDYTPEEQAAIDAYQKTFKRYHRTESRRDDAIETLSKALRGVNEDGQPAFDPDEIINTTMTGTTQFTPRRYNAEDMAKEAHWQKVRDIEAKQASRETAKADLELRIQDAIDRGDSITAINSMLYGENTTYDQSRQPLLSAQEREGFYKQVFARAQQQKGSQVNNDRAGKGMAAQRAADSATQRFNTPQSRDWERVEEVEPKTKIVLETLPTRGAPTRPPEGQTVQAGGKKKLVFTVPEEKAPTPPALDTQSKPVTEGLHNPITESLNPSAPEALARKAKRAKLMEQAERQAAVRQAEDMKQVGIDQDYTFANKASGQYSGYDTPPLVTTVENITERWFPSASNKQLAKQELDRIDPTSPPVTFDAVPQASSPPQRIVGIIHKGLSQQAADRRVESAQQAYNQTQARGKLTEQAVQEGKPEQAKVVIPDAKFEILNLRAEPGEGRGATTDSTPTPDLNLANPTPTYTEQERVQQRDMAGYNAQGTARTRNPLTKPVTPASRPISQATNSLNDIGRVGTGQSGVGSSGVGNPSVSKFPVKGAMVVGGTALATMALNALYSNQRDKEAERQRQMQSVGGW